MSTLWSSSLLDRLETEAEVAISQEVNCIFFRYSFPIVSGTALYTLPASLVNIQAITWLGKKLEQFNPNLHSMDIRPVADSTSSIPQLYMVDTYRYNQIRFYPTPNASIDQVSDANLLKGAGILAGVCLTGFAVADTINYRVPSWLRAQLIEYYVKWKKFELGGKGQSLEAATYYKGKYQNYLDAFKIIIEKIPGAVTHRFGQDYRSHGRTARPILPAEFGR